MSTKEKRRRLAPEDVRNNARESSGGPKFFNLPEDVRLWAPEKAGSYLIDIFPYVVKTDAHPDRRGDRVKPGDIWYRYPFVIHKNVGPDNGDVLCPASFGKRCPICEEKAKLVKHWDENEDAIKAMRAPKHMAFVIRDPDDEAKLAIFAWSKFKFADLLEEEFKTGGDDVLNCYQATDGGQTLKVRFSEDTFEKSKFLKATKIEFVPRADMDEDEVLEKSPCLDEIFEVPEYEALKKLFLQIDEDDSPSDTRNGSGSGKTTAKVPPAVGKPKAEPEEDDDDKGAGEADGPKFKDDDLVSFEFKGKTLSGKVIDVDTKTETYTIEDAAGKEFDVDFDDVSAPKEEKKAAPAKADKKPAAKPKAEPECRFKVGDVVKNDDGETGTLTAVDADDEEATMKLKTGKSKTVDFDDIEIVEDQPEDDDDERGKNDDDAPEIAVGDKVSWEDGDETGEVVKLMPDGERAKVKTEDDELVIYNLTDLTPIPAKKKK